MSVQDEAGRWVRNPQCPSRRELVTLGAGAGMATLLDSPWVASATPTGEQHGWQPVNVQRFGAVGDAKTDDTAAFQRALDAAQMAGGGTVYAPSGQYLFKGTLDIPGGVTLRGSYVYVPSHPDIRDPKVLKPGDENWDPLESTCRHASLSIL